MTAPRIGIVGAGLCGLMAGSLLQEHGLEVTLFDKGRRAGGRCNTREHGTHRFDHGAQYFTVRDPAVRLHVESWVHDGVVAEWTGRLVRLGPAGPEPAKVSTRYVGVPGMIDVATRLARDVTVHQGVRVEEIRRTGSSWTLSDQGGEGLGPFDQVVVALPAAQAAPLLMDAPVLRDFALGVDMDPCWAGMFVFAEALELGFDGAFLTRGPFSWIARDASKPGRPPEESWVAHAGPDWTREHEGTERGRVAELMLQEMAGQLGPLPEVVFQRAHRWGYASANGPGAVGPLYDAELGIGVCGDWCRGGRIEGALLSGIDIARRVMARATAG